MPKDDAFLNRARPWRPQGEVTCPVNPAQKAFIETTMLWLADQFGREVARREMAVPAADFSPPDHRLEPAQIHRLIRRIAARMEVDPDRFKIRFFSSRERREAARDDAPWGTTVGRYGRFWVGEIIEIGLDRSADPAVLTSIIAHELAHARLIGEKRLPFGEAEGEEMADLAAVFLGMGVFVANASVRHTQAAHTITAEEASPGRYTSVSTAVVGRGEVSYQHIGYLNAQEFGYALACLCGVRREIDPPWAIHLHPPVRVMLRRSLAYFEYIAR